MAMKIRTEQIGLLESDLKRRQVGSIIQILQREVPEAVEGVQREELERRVIHALRRAHQFLGKQVNTKAGSQAAMLWIRLMFQVSPDFDRDPSCAAILDDVATPPQGRIISLLREASGIDWNVVSARCGRNWPAAG